MNRKLVLVLAFLLLLVCLQYPRFQQNRVIASDGYPVHNLNTGLNYTAIQEAIDANETTDGHTILVDAGEYNESLLINKSISLKGGNKDDTILDATFQIPIIIPDFWDAAMVNVTANNVEIAGFNLKGEYFNKISARFCSNITIRGNIVTSSGICISLSGGINCTVADNIIVGGGLEGNDLVVLYSCRGSAIQNNTIENACYDGIRLVASNYNLIYGNSISNNQYGIDFYSGPEGGDYGNTIFHNNFENYRQLSGGDGSNYFNESFEGNYWSDYNGKDANQDGIGDTPYANLDFYPLVGAFHDFTVSSPIEGLQSITIISNSTVTDLSLDYCVPTNDSVQSDQPFIKFSVTGQNGTIGFCRVMILKAIMNSSSYVVFVNNKPVNVKQLLISNSTVAYLYFTYSQSTHQVLVFVPEFPSFLTIALFITTTFTMIPVRKRKKGKQGKIYFRFLNSFTPSTSVTKSKPCSMSFAASSTVFAVAE